MGSGRIPFLLPVTTNPSPSPFGLSVVVPVPELRRLRPPRTSSGSQGYDVLKSSTVNVSLGTPLTGDLRTSRVRHVKIRYQVGRFGGDCLRE